MTPENRRQLATLIQNEKEEILREWRERMRPVLSARDLEAPALNNELPIFLDELADKIRDVDTPHSWTEEFAIEQHIEGTAKSHGKQRFELGFDIVEIVKEYGIMREVISDRAESHGLVIGGKGAHVLFYVINKAVSAAVEGFQREKERETRERRKEYLSFVVHDLKTPLNAIMVAAHLIEEQADDGKLVAEMAQIVIRSGEKLNELLEKTIKVEKSADLDGVEDLVPRTFELWPLVQSVIDEVRLQAGVADVTVHNLIPSSFTIYADAVAMKTVFLNLVSNALKYTTAGKIVIGITTTRKDRIEIWVRDSGVGIPTERLKQIFEKVDPDPNKKGSTGLGLFMVKKIVEAHNGTATIESKVGEGTTVRIMLPVARGQ